MWQLANQYPDIVTVEVAAISTEGRNVTGIRISSGGNVAKPIILLDGGIHAREWIAPAMAVYMIHELVENTANRHLLNSVDWHVIPVVNPDGYEYTHTTVSEQNGTITDRRDLLNNHNLPGTFLEENS